MAKAAMIKVKVEPELKDPMKRPFKLLEIRTQEKISLKQKTWTTCLTN